MSNLTAMTGVSATFIRRPVATSLLMAVFLLSGLAAYPFLPIAAVPQVDLPTISVSAQLPGASPETMASTVAQPLERQFSQIPGIIQMTSSSGLGQTSVTVQFDLDRDLDGAAQDIQSAINAAGGQLPRNLPSPPRYQKVNPADLPLAGYAFFSATLPLTELSDLVDNVVVQQLSQIRGVGGVTTFGMLTPAIRVQIDPIKLAATGLSIEDVRLIINNASTNAPKGTIDVGTQSFTIYGNDQISKAEEFNDVVLAFRNGAPVRIRDVGRAVDGPENVRSAAWRKTGEQSVNILLRKQPGANIVETVDQVNAMMPKMLALMPPSVKVERTFDRTTTIRASVAEVRMTLLITAVLVVFIIFVFLRNVWATAIPAMAIPLSLIGTFAGMYAFGFSIDNLSLMAMTIAVGFVVDDAIVMLENIYRHIEAGMKPFDAALQGSSEIVFTILSMSLSLVAVFIPLLLMGGIIGKFFHEFAMVVCLTILISGIVSLTLTPMLCSRYLRHDTGQHGPVYLAVERGFKALSAFYERTLEIALRWPRTILGIFFATVVLAGVLFVIIPKGFFPQQDVGTMNGSTEGAKDASFAEMYRLSREALAIISADPAVEYTFSALGSGRAANGGMLSVMLKPLRDRDATVEEVIARLRPKFAQLSGFRVFLQASQDINVGGRPAKTQFQYTLQDVDTAELEAFATKLQAKMEGLPELRDVSSDQQGGASSATIVIDRDMAARYGIQPQLIDDTLYSSFGQRQVGQYFTQVNTYKIILEVLPEMQGDLRTLDKIFVKSPSTGRQIPLSTFVKYDTNSTRSMSINHQGQFPAITLSFNITPGVALGDAVEAVKRAQDELGTPPSLNATFEGTAKAFEETLRSQPYLIGAAILAVYIILGILYESFIYPLAILSTLPSAGVGALLILIVSGYELSVIALIAIILLIGLVKKNGIMMVDFAVKAMRERGAAPGDAIREACRLRFRPIMMTSMAALLGGIPLIIAGGPGYELRRPLGVAMVGGLIFSQVLTLYTTPVVFLYLERFRDWSLGRKAAKAGESPVQHPAE